MSGKKNAEKGLWAELEELKIRLNETEETLNAIRRGEVDAIEQFSYVASHDLQESLRMVSRFTQLLQHAPGEGSSFFFSIPVNIQTNSPV